MITKTFRTIDDLIAEIRARYPEVLIQVKSSHISDDFRDNSYLFLIFKNDSMYIHLNLDFLQEVKS